MHNAQRIRLLNRKVSRHFVFYRFFHLFALHLSTTYISTDLFLNMNYFEFRWKLIEISNFCERITEFQYFDLINFGTQLTNKLEIELTTPEIVFRPKISVYYSFKKAAQPLCYSGTIDFTLFFHLWYHWQQTDLQDYNENNKFPLAAIPIEFNL